MGLIAENVNPIGMSYWRNINNHLGSNVLKVVLSRNDNLIVLVINKETLEVVNEVPLGITHTGEGCFFSAIEPNRLFVPFDDSLKMLDIVTGNFDTVWQSQDKLWQMHASLNERVFSATVKDSNYNVISWAVLINGQEKRYPIKGEPDECQIDKSGNWLLIKENNYNRIINIQTDEEYIIQNEEGALGHSDCDFERALGENDMSNLPGALDSIDFRSREHTNLYSTGIWNMGYVSVQNNQILLTTPTSLILVNEDRKICDHDSEDDSYEHRPKANLCPFGQYAAFTSYVNGQLNAYLVRI